MLRSILGALLLFACPLFAATPYAIGTPVLQDVWVDPVSGSDSNSGATRAAALRTLDEAWNRIPREETLTGHGYRIQLVAGNHARTTIPTYFESRWGTASCPIIIQSADAPRSARVQGDFNIYDTRYLYLIGLDIVPDPAGDVFHCEKCDHILLRDSHFDGGAHAAQEVIKVNQSQYVYVEDSDVHGAWNVPIDFVAVQYGHVIRTRIHDGDDWCMYFKGGSAYLRVEQNEMYDCGTGGFSAGQGTGFQFMVPPWLHYETYGIRAINNVVHDVSGAGFGVNGGYNILIAQNRVNRAGTRSHLFEAVYGGRSCDGPADDPTRTRCASYLAAGGWGNTLIADGENFTRIPNRNVFVYNNVFENPASVVAPQFFTIAAPFTAQASPAAVADTNLQIRGNVFMNGDGSTPLGVGEGCAPSNPTCNATQLAAENLFIGTELNPTPMYAARTFSIPDFSWSDAPAGVPAGDTSNAGVARALPGTYEESPKRRATRH